MSRTRLLPALALGAGLLLAVQSLAQPPLGPPVVRPVAEPALPVVPKSAGAFVTLKVSDLVAHPDLKQVLAELAKQPDALVGITEAIGVTPLELDRVTLFWPRSIAGGADPILVITTREPFNEARVLKALRARPVFDDDRGYPRFGAGNSAPKAAAPDFKNFPAPSTKSAVPEVIGPPPFPKGFEPKASPPPALKPPPKEDETPDTCGGSGDGGPSDPLFYAPDRGAFAALFLIDERTMVFLPRGSDAEFTGMALLAATLKKNATGPLADAIAAAGRHVFAAGASLAPVFQQFDRRMPSELVPYTALFAARTAVITGDLDKAAKLTLTLTFRDAAAARRAAPVLGEGIATVAGKVAGVASELSESRRPFEKSAAPLVAAFAGALKKSSVKAVDAAVIATAEMDAGPAAAKALGDLLQAVQSRQKAEVRMNNLKQIGLALHSYHDVYGRFPANVYGPKAKSELLLSWRVQLLPFLEQDNLYKQFKMDEPWDGPNNKLLIDKMPTVFQAPGRDAPKGMTFYQGFVGPAQLPKGIFGNPWLREGAKTGLRIFEITDGTSNTLAVIEAGQGVMWTKPDDLPFGGVVPQLGAKGWDRTPALRFDGSVTLFPTDLTPERFWPYVTINGGEVTEDIEERGPFGGRRAPVPAVETTVGEAVKLPAASKPPEPPKK